MRFLFNISKLPKVVKEIKLEQNEIFSSFQWKTISKIDIYDLKVQFSLA